MVGGEMSLDNPSANRSYAVSGLGRWALLPILIGLLTAASILMLIYQENRAVQYGIEATEVSSAYQVKNLQASVEEDPNLKAQYAEEQDVLRQRAEELKQRSSNARNAVLISAYSALLLFLGAAAAVLGLLANSVHAGYAGLFLGIIGLGLGIRALF
jgi:hypothetical protein